MSQPSDESEWASDGSEWNPEDFSSPSDDPDNFSPKPARRASKKKVVRLPPSPPPVLTLVPHDPLSANSVNSPQECAAVFTVAPSTSTPRSHCVELSDLEICLRLGL